MAGRQPGNDKALSTCLLKGGIGIYGCDSANSLVNYGISNRVACVCPLHGVCDYCIHVLARGFISHTQ